MRTLRARSFALVARIVTTLVIASTAAVAADDEPALAAPDVSGWYELELEAEGFRALLPGEPAYDLEVFQTILGTVSASRYVYETATEHFAVERHRLPRLAGLQRSQADRQRLHRVAVVRANRRAVAASHRLGDPGVPLEEPHRHPSRVRQSGERRFDLVDELADRSLEHRRPSLDLVRAAVRFAGSDLADRLDQPAFLAGVDAGRDAGGGVVPRLQGSAGRHQPGDCRVR